MSSKAPPQASAEGARRLLVVAHSCPWPPTSGGKIDMFGRLRALRDLGLAVDLVMTVKEEARERAQVLKTELGLGTCEIIPRRRTLLRALHPLVPFQVASRQGPAWARLSCRAGVGCYAAVLAEGSYVLPMAASLAAHLQAPLLHRLHNLESRYFHSLARSETRPVHKVFYLLESVRFRLLERRLFSQAVHLCISTEECETVAAAYPGLAFWLPPALAALPETPAPLREEVQPHFLVTGSLSLPDTWQGVHWLAERLWPRIRRELPQARLTVAGRRPEPQAAAFLERIPGLRVCYDVPDMTPLFREADIYLSPILQGAGVKIKTVEALSHGLPVVATPVAAQGCGLVAGEHLLVAQTEAEFVAACVRLAREKELRRRLAAAGRDYVRRAFDHPAHLRRLLTHLQIIP